MSGRLDTLCIRRALPGEAGTLTALAIRSKAHWGYDAEFMRLAAPELEITPALVEGAAAFVAEDAGTVLGFYVLSIERGLATLNDLWIDPPAIGKGLGQTLWRHMLGEARLLGYRTIRLQSDPNAEGFYAKMGARRVGVVPSKVFPGRTLPLMEIDVG